MRNDFESNYLMHHGILGQKWGKRNGPPYPLNQSQKSKAEKKREDSKDSKTQETSQQKKKHLTDEQKRKLIRNGAIAAGVALAVVGGMYMVKKGKLNPTHIAWFKYGTKMDLSILTDDPITISKKTKLQRISNKKIEDYAGEGKRIYASYLKHDNHLYKEQIPKYIKRWNKEGLIEGGTNAYVHKMTLKRDIKLASTKATMEAYMKVNNTNEVDLGHFRQFVINLADTNNKKTKEFYKEITSRGFDGLIDFNDASGNTTKWAESPIILINPSEVINSSKSHKLRSVEKFINVITS